MVLGDVDDDGDLDIVAAAYNSGQNRLYLNDGSGGFSATGTVLGSESDDTRSVVLGDVDRDGDLDLVAGNFNQTNKLYRNVVYRTSGQIVVSAAVNNGLTVSNAVLSATDTANTASTRNTSIDYFLSNDGGAHWYRVYSGKGFAFPAPGPDLRWKAEFSSLTPSKTPALNHIYIDLDNDVDGTGDFTDTDDDNDGLSDIVESQLGTAPLVFNDQTQPLVGSTNIDSDGDGLSDNYEINVIQTNPNIANPGVAIDTDGDGLTDYFEINVSGTDANTADTVYTGTLPDLGDLNEDGQINLADLLLLQKQILGVQ